MSLVSKLAEVMAAVERIPKRGRNDFHKYDYATEADIAATVREELAKRHVMLIPSITGESRHPVGEKGSILTILEMEMEFLDGEDSTQSIKKAWRGYGTDKDDKGGYKAMTGGEKYFLLKTFLMPTGDDPENDSSKAGYVVSAQAVAPSRGVAPTALPPSVPNGETSGALTIVSVRVNPTNNANVRKAVIVLSDDRQVRTIKEKLIALCVQIQQEGGPVTVVTKTSEQWGEELTDVKRVLPEIQIRADLDDPHSQPVDVDQVPF